MKEFQVNSAPTHILVSAVRCSFSSKLDSPMQSELSHGDLCMFSLRVLWLLLLLLRSHPEHLDSLQSTLYKIKSTCATVRTHSTCPSLVLLHNPSFFPGYFSIVSYIPWCCIAKCSLTCQTWEEKDVKPVPGSFYWLGLPWVGVQVQGWQSPGRCLQGWRAAEPAAEVSW